MPYLSMTGAAHPVGLCYIASHLEALRELEHLARMEQFLAVHAEPWPDKVEARPPLANCYFLKLMSCLLAKQLLFFGDAS
jgi:hypothetical protein